VLEILRTLILDFQEQRLSTGVPRRQPLPEVPGKATVVIGVRRGGKSTLLFQIIERLVARGVARQNILYLNFFDDRLHGLTADRLRMIPEAYYSLFPEKQGTEVIYCFFDEIQVVSGWEPFVDRLLRTERCQVYLTGSSAHMLSTEIATQMRGRALSWELFPFSFAEFLASRGTDPAQPATSRRQRLIQKHFEEYWETGGFPEVLDLDRTLRTRIHQEYFHAIISRDLVERHDAAHPRAVADLAHWLVDNTASAYSVNRLTGYLKSLGHKVHKTAVADYLGWFEDAYLLFSVRLFDASAARSHANPKKVYCIDHALATSVSAGILRNSGHLLENLVFTALRRTHPLVYYYRTRGGREVDFVLPVGRERLLIQVCESLADPQTRAREVSALNEAMRELATDRSAIVTRAEQETIDTHTGRIDVVPAWRFLLEPLPSR
jgi:predicted AAA+ superfamily ATPase